MTRIVVVEDDAVVRAQVVRCLAARGHLVVTAENSEDGLVRVYESQTAILVTDIYLPGLDGFALAESIRRDPSVYQPDIIFMSIGEERELYRRAMQLGGCDFLNKPFTCKEIGDAVATRLANRLLLGAPTASIRTSSQSTITASAVSSALPEIEGYRIIRRLGEGHTSQVLLASPHNELNQHELHALKLLKLPREIAGQREAINRFLGEYAMLAGLKHPNVARVYAHGISGDYLYLDMEYLPGADLRLDIQAGMSPKIAQRRAAEMAAALGAIHEAGIVHRDLKPANVLMRMTGEAVLTDFGIAKNLASQLKLTEQNMAVGTPYYMSPEQATAGDVDARSDLYGLGIVLFEMLTGLPPYRDNSGNSGLEVFAQHLHAPVPTLPDAFGVFQPVISKLLAKKAQDRYADANEARQAILKVAC